MRQVRHLSWFVLCCCVYSGAVADEVTSDVSRQDLFESLQLIEQRQAPFALPRNFVFPDSARETSAFGIDISHHTKSQCQCDLDWNTLAEKRIRFVYAKATQGTRFKDPEFDNYRSGARETSKIRFGSYHFMTADEDAASQAKFYLQVVGALASSDMPPSLDLEWHPGPRRVDCPANGVVPLRRHDGTIAEACDLWSSVRADEIISRVNLWIDMIFQITGRPTVLYTNSSWWQARIGDGNRVNELHTRLVWIADYSRGGLAMEKPSVPGHGTWSLWQFTDRAVIQSSSKTLLVDATIADTNVLSSLNLTNGDVQ